MAGDWIKMRVVLDTEPEVILMAAALGLDRLCVVGRLWKVWSWADQHSVDGNAVRVTCAFLDQVTNCPGFAKAMRDARWLEGRDGALTFPRFDRHNGHPAKKRALTKDRVNEHRNAHSVTGALPEKRREEIKKPPSPPEGGAGEEDGEAEKIYRLYPRKTKDRSRALEAIRAALELVDPDTLRAAVARFARAPNLGRENGRFIPAPANWFGDQCWKDYLPKPESAAPAVFLPSKALEDVRYMLARGMELSEQERHLTLQFVGQLTVDDAAHLTAQEKERINQLQQEPVR